MLKTIRIARTEKELKDVFKLRYQVYVKQEGYFKDVSTKLITDQFDSTLQTVNVIAYSGIQPIATIRINCDSEILLPCDEMFNFKTYRDSIIAQRKAQDMLPPIFGCASMLAIAKPWRNRRDVFMPLLKIACGYAKNWEVSHLIATVNDKEVSIYKKMGFAILAEPFWVSSIGETLSPVWIDFTRIYQWAFSAIPKNTP